MDSSGQGLFEVARSEGEKLANTHHKKYLFLL